MGIGLWVETGPTGCGRTGEEGIECMGCPVAEGNG